MDLTFATTNIIRALRATDRMRPPVVGFERKEGNIVAFSCGGYQIPFELRELDINTEHRIRELFKARHLEFKINDDHKDDDEERR